MIRLSDERQRILKAAFDGVPDRDLIQELVRRGRFVQVQHSRVFWKEMRGDDGYMEAIREGVMRGVARTLRDHKSKLFLESETDVDRFSIETASGAGDAALTADVIALCARDKQENTTAAERGPCLFPTCRGQCGRNTPCGPTMTYDEHGPAAP